MRLGISFGKQKQGVVLASKDGWSTPKLNSLWSDFPFVWGICTAWDTWEDVIEVSQDMSQLKSLLSLKSSETAFEFQSLVINFGEGDPSPNYGHLEKFKRSECRWARVVRPISDFPMPTVRFLIKIVYTPMLYGNRVSKITIFRNPDPAVWYLNNVINEVDDLFNF